MNIDWTFVVYILTAAIALYALYRTFKTGTGTVVLTPETVVTELKESYPIALELKEIAQVAVNSVEELRRQGKITDNKEALDLALTRVKKWVPDEWEISNEDIFAAIDAAILVASALRAQADPLNKG